MTLASSQNNVEVFASGKDYKRPFEDLLPQRTYSVPTFTEHLIDGPKFCATSSSKHLFIKQIAKTVPKIVRSASLPLLCRSQSMCYQGFLQPQAKEEASICRICMLEIEEEGETFKMQCSCKGQLALAHKSCAVKWFNIRGNMSCDVCGSEVHNLPVILLHLQSSSHYEDGQRSSWRHIVTVILGSLLESLWHKLEELSEFP